MAESNCETVVSPDGVRFVFKGRLDSAACALYETSVVSCNERSGKKVVFDMKDVAYVASAFLRICLRVAKDPAGGGLKLVNVTPAVKMVFKIAGIDNLVAD